MIKYLLEITVAPFKSHKKQMELEEKIVEQISNLNYVGSCHIFKFQRGLNHEEPKYSVPNRKNLPKVFEEPEIQVSKK